MINARALPGDNLPDLISSYWYYREGLETAIECTTKGCPRHDGNDKEKVTAIYKDVMTDFCHRIVSVIEDTILNNSQR